MKLRTSAIFLPEKCQKYLSTAS